MLRIIAAALLSVFSGTLPATADDWSGFYAGGGVSWSRVEQSFPNAINNSFFNGQAVALGEEDETFAGHVLGGYMHQTGSWIFGAEADVEFANSVKWDPVDTAGCQNPGNVGSRVCIGSFGSFRSIGHVRAIGGVAISDRFMAFVAGGAGLARAELDGVYGLIGSGGGGGGLIRTDNARDKHVFGYSVGGGIQVKATERIALRAEVMYDRYEVDIEDVIGGATSIGFPPTAAASYTTGNTSRYDNTTARISAIFRF